MLQSARHCLLWAATTLARSGRFSEQLEPWASRFGVMQPRSGSVPTLTTAVQSFAAAKAKGQCLWQAACHFSRRKGHTAYFCNGHTKCHNSTLSVCCTQTLECVACNSLLWLSSDESSLCSPCQAAMRTHGMIASGSSSRGVLTIYSPHIVSVLLACKSHMSL